MFQGQIDPAILMEAMDFEGQEVVLEKLRAASGKGIAALQQQIEQLTMAVQQMQAENGDLRGALTSAQKRTRFHAGRHTRTNLATHEPKGSYFGAAYHKGRKREIFMENMVDVANDMPQADIAGNVVDASELMAPLETVEEPLAGRRGTASRRCGKNIHESGS